MHGVWQRCRGLAPKLLSSFAIGAPVTAINKKPIQGESLPRRVARWLACSLALVLGAAVVGTLLLCLVTLIPQELLEENVREAASVLYAEGDHPEVFSGSRGTWLDNYSDAVMISTSYFSLGDVLSDALLVPHVSLSDSDPLVSLYQWFYGTGLDASDFYMVTYGRYWHGYQVFLKPLLVVMGYSSIRSLNMVLQVAAVLGLMYALVKRGWDHLCPPVLLLWVSLSPATLMWSLQYSAVFYSTVLGCVALVLAYDRLDTLGRCLVFEGIGVTVAYLDLSSYPIVSLGVPLILLLSLEWGRPRTVREVAAEAVALCASWAVGYGGMWAMKWVIATALTDEDVIVGALAAAALRMSDLDDSFQEGAYTFWGVLKSNASQLFSVGFIVAFVACAVAGVVLLVRRGRAGARSNWPATAAVLAACLIPFVWYFVVLNHSGTHYWMTWRCLAITAYGLMTLLWAHVWPARGVATGERREVTTVRS